MGDKNTCEALFLSLHNNLPCSAFNKNTHEIDFSVKHDIYTYIRTVCIAIAIALTSFCAMAQSEAKSDSIRYAVQKTSPTNEKDLERKPVDLRNPENLTTETTYDEKTHTYIVGNKIGDSYLSVPLLMTPEEYAEWSMKRSLDAYFRAKNQEEFEKEGKKEKFDFTDMKFDL